MKSIIPLLKTHYIKALYHLASLRPFQAAVHSRQPFVRYPYMYLPSQLVALTNLLLSVRAAGAVIEVGCNQGWTSCWLVEALREAGIHRPYHCLDTFTGFCPRAVPALNRGKADDLPQHFC